MFVKHDNTTIVSFIDNQQKGYVFATSTGFVTEIKNWKVDTIGMLWQLGGCNSAELLIGWSTSQMYIYAYHPSTWKEPSAAFLLVASVDFPLVQQPLLFKNDNLIYFGRDEKINSYVLQCFKELDTGEMASKYPTEADKIEYLKTLSTLGKSPCLRKYEACISSPKIWSTVAEHMLMHLQINDAKMIYGEILHDLGMTKTLQRIQLVEDKYEVQGHIAVLFEMFQYAKDCFLKSCSPKEAVFLFMDLLEWKDALKLAEEHAPDQLGKISFEYAMQLEIQGKHSDALSLLSRVPLQSSNSSLEKERNDGVIRMTCATGNVINAMNLLHNVRDPIILKECALLLESISQFKEAATLLEKGEFWEEAAMCWIKSKNFHRAEMALNRAKSKQPYIVLGDAYVKEKMYLEADTAYKMAEHYDGVVSVLIDCLADLEGGAEQARKTKSFESCKSLGNHFSRVGNHARAIEFYVLSGLNNKAFRIATERNLMHEFISFMEDNDFIPLRIDILIRIRGSSLF